MNAPAAPAYSPADPRSRSTAEQPAPAGPPEPASPVPAAPRGPRIEPGHRLDPAASGRAWRPVLIVLASLLVLAVVSSVATISLVSWRHRADFPPISATWPLGTPTSIELSTSVGAIRVIRSADAQGVSLALVRPGTEPDRIPDALDAARAKVAVDSHGSTTKVHVEQPYLDGPVPWEDSTRDLLLVLPEDHAAALTLTTRAGSLSVEGGYQSIRATTNAGPIELKDVSAAEGIVARTDAGEVQVGLAPGATRSVTASSSVGDIAIDLTADAVTDVDARADVGDVSVAAPGRQNLSVQATSDTGEVAVAPELATSSGTAVATVQAHSSMGDVTVTR